MLPPNKTLPPGRPEPSRPGVPRRPGAAPLPYTPQRPKFNPGFNRPGFNKPGFNNPVFKTPGFNQSPAGSAPMPAAASSVSGGVTKMAIFFGMALMFVRFAQFHEMLTYVLGVNTYILYLFGPMSLVCFFLTGGLGRLTRNRCAIYCLLLALFMAAATATSTWKGDSLGTLDTFVRTNMIMLAVLGGLDCEWKDIRRIMTMAAMGGALSILNGKLFPKDFGGRPGLAFGTVANPDDYAAHLMLLSPFLLWVALDSKRNFIFRAAAAAFIALAVQIALGTASRGALVSLAVGCVFFFFHASSRQRMTMMLAVPVLIGLFLSVSSSYTLNRILSFSRSGTVQDEEALESSEMRRELLIQSLTATVTHPLLGVGPGQFANYEGNLAVQASQLGLWHGTHNSFTQISSECGLPAVFLYIGSVVSAFGLLRKVYRRAAQNPLNRDIGLLVLSVMLSFVCFFTAITFLNFGYSFYMPTLVGLACAIHFSAMREMDRREQPQNQLRPSPQPLRAGVQRRY
jgi:O-antigen ligase